jgi:hypothetical protein
MSIFTWFQTHYQDILFVITGLISVASVIVRWTPTLKDDTFLLKVIKFLGRYIALNRNVPDDEIRAKQ